MNFFSKNQIFKKNFFCFEVGGGGGLEEVNCFFFFYKESKSKLKFFTMNPNLK